MYSTLEKKKVDNSKRKFGTSLTIDDLYFLCIICRVLGSKRKQISIKINTISNIFEEFQKDRIEAYFFWSE